MVKYIKFRQQERWFGPDVLMLNKELRNKLKSQYTSADNAEAGSELDGLVKATPHIKVFLQGPSQGADRKGTREGLPAHSLCWRDSWGQLQEFYPLQTSFSLDKVPTVTSPH